MRGPKAGTTKQGFVSLSIRKWQLLLVISRLASESETCETSEIKRAYLLLIAERIQSDHHGSFRCVVDNALCWAMKSSLALRNGATTALVMTRGRTRGLSSLRNFECLRRSLVGREDYKIPFGSISRSCSYQWSLQSELPSSLLILYLANVYYR
jgi:hypothetical protein